MKSYFAGFCRLSLAFLLLAPLCLSAAAQDNSSSAPDTLVLTDGNTLHGTLVSSVDGNVNFKIAALGTVKIPWKDVRELHTTGIFVVLSSQQKDRGKKSAANLPEGAIDATPESVTVHPAGDQPVPQPVPTKDAQFIIDKATMDQQLHHRPGFLEGWNGSATAGATLVTATQSQYTVSGGLGLIRTVPTVGWLDTRNRTSADFSGSFGKITQPGYTGPAGPVAATVSKTSIIHLDAERDQYISSRIFALVQTSFDHNYSQNLNLQQIYGGGLGWTALKTPDQVADLKATMQYEKQSFITGPASANQNLIGSTFSADYQMSRKLFTFTQQIAYIPAWNNARAYSADETDTVAFPTWKKFGFSVDTMDSYLNDPPASLPPTKRNSFQFSMGLTYAFKSKY